MERLQEFISVSQAGKISGYNPDYISSLIRSGKLQGKKVGKNWITTADELERYMRSVGQPSSASSRRFFYTLKLGGIILAISIVIVFLLYGAYSVVYENAYQNAQTASTTASDVVQQGTQATTSQNGLSIEGTIGTNQ